MTLTSHAANRNPPSLIILGWPYGRAFPKLQFTEFVSDPIAAANEVIAKGPDAGKKKYIDIRTFVDSNIAIGHP